MEIVTIKKFLEETINTDKTKRWFRPQFLSASDAFIHSNFNVCPWCGSRPRITINYDLYKHKRPFNYEEISELNITCWYDNGRFCGCLNRIYVADEHIHPETKRKIGSPNPFLTIQEKWNNMESFSVPIQMVLPKNCVLLEKSRMENIYDDHYYSDDKNNPWRGPFKLKIFIPEHRNIYEKFEESMYPVIKNNTYYPIKFRLIHENITYTARILDIENIYRNEKYKYSTLSIGGVYKGRIVTFGVFHEYCNITKNKSDESWLKIQYKTPPICEAVAKKLLS